MGWRPGRRSRSATTQLPDTTKRYLQAYSDGVNAYLKDHPSGRALLEYAILGLQGTDYTPEPWTPDRLHRLAQGDGLGPRGNMQDEIDRSLMTARHDARSDRRALPGLPLQPQQARSCDGGSVVGTGPDATFEPPGTATGGTPALSTSETTALTASAASSAPWTSRSNSLPALLGPSATASAPTPGWSPASTPRPANRCWPTTRTWRPSSPRSGTRWVCTARR